VLSLFGRCGARQLFVAADPLSDAPAQQPEYREDPLLRPAASGLRGYGEKPGGPASDSLSRGATLRRRARW